MAVWSKALPLTASCLSPLAGLKVPKPKSTTTRTGKIKTIDLNVVYGKGY